MVNRLAEFIRRYDMVQPGDRIICALSGGADSVALLLGLYLLRERMGITLEAAHYNHCLRGEESDADEAFVRSLCHHYDIPLHVGRGQVRPGKKGLEAAARDARYAYLRSLGGKIATAHTADDNAETVLLHLVRGTGLKGLGGITPVSENLVRPMLTITRQQVEEFLGEYCQKYITDSSNLTDQFLRNRLRRQVMPLLKGENPRLAENLSAMALRLRQDEDCLAGLAGDTLPDIHALRAMHPALRSRALDRFLKEAGVREPEQSHIALAESLVFSEKPSASVRLPGGVTIARNYHRLEKQEPGRALGECILTDGLELPEAGLRIAVFPARSMINDAETFTLCPQGDIRIRARREGDALTLSGGTKSLKKRFIDRKIPASWRALIPVLEDDAGILGVYSLGADRNRIPRSLPAVTIRFEKI